MPSRERLTRAGVLCWASVAHAKALMPDRLPNARRRGYCTFGQPRFFTIIYCF